jgi:hypothetical protein
MQDTCAASVALKLYGVLKKFLKMVLNNVGMTLKEKTGTRPDVDFYHLPLLTE